MTQTSSRKNEDLIQSLLDGELSQADFDLFQDRLRAEPELRRAYMDYASLYHALSESGEELQVSTLEAVEEIPLNTIPLTSAYQPKKRRFPAIPLGIAAVVALSGVVAWYGTRPGIEAIPPALATFGPQASWQFSDAEGENLSGSQLPANGTLSLTRGTTQLELAKGVTAWVQAPAKLTYLDPLHVRFEEGRAHFHVTEKGHGFRVTTPDLEVIDLGTRFGLSALPGHPEEVHVLEGTVIAKNPSKELTLNLGEAVQLQPDGMFQSLPADPSLFPGRLTREILVFRENFNHTAGPLDQQNPYSGKGPWVVSKGTPQLDGKHLQGGVGEMAIHGRLNAPQLGADHPILLVTLQTGPSGSFHSGGYAGLSLFRGNDEVVFFGDCFGGKNSWGLDVRRDGKPRYPETAVAGARAVTLRYHFLTGNLSLFHGEKAHGLPFLETKTQPELILDRLRIAQGDGGEINVDEVSVRILSDR